MTTKPTLHQNGFVQFDLAPDVYLHIWSPRLPEPKAVHRPIHDHTSNFRSRVLTGTLHHDVFVWVPTSRDPDYTLHTARPWLTGDNLLRSTNEHGFMNMLEQNTLGPDSEYVFKAGWFHEVYADGLTASIMMETRKHLRETSRVAVSFGITPGPHYETDEDAALMAELVEEVWPFVPVEYKV